MQCVSVISYLAAVPCPGPLPSSDLFKNVCDFYFFKHTPFHLCLCGC